MMFGRPSAAGSSVYSASSTPRMRIRLFTAICETYQTALSQAKEFSARGAAPVSNIVSEGLSVQCEPQSQHNFDDRKASQPSRNMSGVTANAASGSAHDLPQMEITAQPARAIHAI